MRASPCGAAGRPTGSTTTRSRRLPGNGIDVAVQFSKDDRQQARDNLIDFNLFRSRAGGFDEKEEDDDDGERRPSVGLYLGQFSARKGRDNMLAYGRVGTVVEHNLFLDYRRQNAIHIKSLGNIIRYNSFIDQKRSNHVSKITVRSGQFNEVVANYMDGTTGLRIFEEHNRAIGNVLVGGAELAVWPAAATRPGSAARSSAGPRAPSLPAMPAAHHRLLPQPPREGARQEHGGGGAPGACRDGPGGGAVVHATTTVAVPKASPLTAAEVGLLAPTRAARRPDHRPGRTGPRAWRLP